MRDLSPEEIGAIKPCVGCGFCCKKAPCDVARRVFGPVTQCPALEYDGKRYWCGVVRKRPDGGYKEELYIGDGCCCGLNSDRQNIPPPEAKVAVNPIEKQCQVLLRALAREFISGDALWLAINAASRELGKEWGNQALRLLKQDRMSHVENFMG